MQRYFVDTKEEIFTLSNDDSYHITKVMRNKIGDKVEVVIDKELYICEIVSLDKQVLVKKLEKEWGNVNGYSLVAKMNMQSGAQTKQYNVEVWHTKPDFYRVQVNEKDNEATQVIVKNDEGVFVVSPSLNKTYEFQSDWPNKNSQAYFIHTLLSDLKAVKDLQMKESDNEFEFEIATQNEDKTGLPLQKIKIDKKTYHPKSVALLDEAGEEKIHPIALDAKREE